MDRAMELAITYAANGQTHTTAASDPCLTVTESRSERITVAVSAKAPVTLLSATLTLPYVYGRKERIFVNGYQSWTDTKEFLAGEKLRDIRRLPKALVRKFAFEGYGDSAFKTYRPGVLHGFDISYGDNIFIGSLNFRSAYLIINHDVKHNTITLESDIGGLNLTGEICLFDFTLDRAWFLAQFPPQPIPNLLGYTSWYNYYEDIDAQKLLENLAAVDKPFQLFQIDDGYETAVGDWMSIDPRKFPSGLTPIVEEIHRKGLMAGIWLAPLAAEQESQVYQQHPDWFLADKAGGNWSGFYGLDAANPEAMAYMERCLRFYADMGFDFFKLDFLYAVNPRRITTRTRAQITADAYARIRRALPGKIILGCGAMIMNSYGNFDYLRIGPDVSLKFDDVWYMRFMHRERVSTKVTLQNTVYRSFLDKRLFGTDPDVFILRDENNQLSQAQKEALITINALFGSLLMTSDNVGGYDEAKKAIFRRGLKLREATQKEYRRAGDAIDISYQLDGTTHRLRYDTKRGILHEQ